MTNALTTLLLLLAPTLVQAESRKDTLDFWTPEQLENAISLHPILSEDGEHVYLEHRVGNGLFKLEEREDPNERRERRRLNKKNGDRSARRLGLLEPADGSVLEDPYTIDFKASVELYDSLTDLSFVFEHESVSTPVAVLAKEIGDDDVATEIVGGFADGEWTWYLQGTDSNGELVKSETTQTFTIQGASDRRLTEVVASDDWTLGGEGGGQAQEATGRIYLVDGGQTYTCSGTAVKDYKTGRSLILTAAHCVFWFDFATTVLFIPNRDGNTGATTSSRQRKDCSEDPCGCWTASGGVVLDRWTQQRNFSPRIPYDYGFYVVDDETGFESGTPCNANSDALDENVDAMTFVTETEVIGEQIYGMGYPGFGDLLKYCTDEVRSYYLTAGETWYMNGCHLLGGSSGGPWIKNMNTNTGQGQVVAVNSFGYSSRSGMGAAIIDPTSARCMFNHARNSMDLAEVASRAVGEQGDIVPFGSCAPTADDIRLAAAQVPSGSGDPHFKTWTGDKFDYHGECDLVLVDNPSFNNGQGLKLHIRTTRVNYYSYIERIALQIGDETLEFYNDVDNFLINGELVEKKRKHHKQYLGGFLIRRDPKAISVRLDNKRKTKIDFIRRKTGFPAVVVDNGGTDLFQGSLGLLGEWGTGKKLARDGQTVMNEEDATNFALEWQVRDTEPMLFKDSRYPQFPTQCTPPKKMMGARLGMSRAKEEAEKACAHWKEDKEDCIFDTLATRDLAIASEGSVVA